jgi:methylated-DNA-[protein]-cysteine S-methyltransferase
MRLLYHVVSAPPPLGLLFLAVTENGVRHLEFLDRRSLKRAIASHAAENPGATWEASVRALRPLADLLEHYFTGGAKHLHVPLDLPGDAFQLQVWNAVLEVPYGETVTAGEIAKRLGDPRAARAVTQACGENPVAILVPCHRVTGPDGRLGGFRGGLPRQKFLVTMESRFRGLQPLEGDTVIAPMHRKVKREAPAARPARVRKPVSRSGRTRGPAAAPRRRPVAAAAAPASARRARSK